MTSAQLPDIDSCVAVYLDVWEAFEIESFSVSDLVVDLNQRNPESVLLDADGPKRRLDLLVAYGLLEKPSDDRYRVRCRPDETKLEWQERLESRIQRLHDAVHATREARAAEPNRPVLAYRGQKYVSVFVDEVGRLVDITDTIGDIEELHAGVALRSPATRADAVQDIADELCNGSAPDIEAAPFEKVNSEVKGADSDDLEFRLYIAPQV